MGTSTNYCSIDLLAMVGEETGQCSVFVNIDEIEYVGRTYKVESLDPISNYSLSRIVESIEMGVIKHFSSADVAESLREVIDQTIEKDDQDQYSHVWDLRERLDLEIRKPLLGGYYSHPEDRWLKLSDADNNLENYGFDTGYAVVARIVFDFFWL